MDRQLKAWELNFDRIWSAATIDYREAAWLVADISRYSDDEPLRRAAVQALPGLRSVMLKYASASEKELVRIRLAAVRDVLRGLTAPRFGKRGIEPEQLTPEELHRKMLGLPLDRCLSAPEIHQAYKRAAKTVHPDTGGSVPEFLALSAAREALMKER